MTTINEPISCTFCPNIMAPSAASHWEQIDVGMFVCPKCRGEVMARPTTPVEASKELYEQEDSQRAEDYYGSHYQNSHKAIKQR